MSASAQLNREKGVQDSTVVRTICGVALLLLLAGCDAPIGVNQIVQIQVSEPRTAVGLAEAKVDFAEKYGVQADISPNEWLDQHGGEQQTTDSSGQAMLNLEFVVACGGILPGIIPGCGDVVKQGARCKPLLIRIGKESLEEVMVVKLEPGAMVVGDHFAVTVTEVQAGRRADLDDLRPTRP
jgi:hypothetical protein